MVSFNSSWPRNSIWRRRSWSRPDGTNLLSQQKLPHYLRGVVVFTWEQFHNKRSRYLSLIWVWKLLIKHYNRISHGPMNTLRPRQDGRHFQTTFSDGFSWMKLYEFRTKISLKFVPSGPINNIPALFQIMAWCRSGDMTLSEPMMVSLLTHICITRPQWVSIWIPEQNWWHCRGDKFKRNILNENFPLWSWLILHLIRYFYARCVREYISKNFQIQTFSIR